MRTDMTTTKKKKEKTMTVLMTNVEVYEMYTEEKIGYGWVFSTDYGMTAPELFNLHGAKLDAGWYRLVPGESRLAIMTETIQ